MPTLSVFIGRFQAPHIGHLSVMSHALHHSDALLILVGSATRARSAKNPFTVTERIAFLRHLLGNDPRVIIKPLADSLYDDPAWARRVTQAATQTAHDLGMDTICLTGFEKDRTSAYLSWFPTWQALPVAPYEDALGLLHATDLRTAFWNEAPMARYGEIAGLLETWKTENPDLFATLQAEHAAGLRSKTKLADAKNVLGYAVPLNTVDGVLLHEDKVLLVQRMQAPGAGLWALPGGFIDGGETAYKAVFREVLEETGLVVAPQTLVKRQVFDHPDRSDRGWLRTEAFVFRLQDAPTPVADGSEIKACAWVRLADIVPTQLFEDHYDIIEYLMA